MLTPADLITSIYNYSGFKDLIPTITISITFSFTKFWYNMDIITATFNYNCSPSPATTTSSSSSPPPIVVSPCAACKILRRRCANKCVLAPYFPPTEPLKFTIAHRVFGASNIIKFLQVSLIFITYILSVKNSTRMINEWYSVVKICWISYN